MLKINKTSIDNMLDYIKICDKYKISPVTELPAKGTVLVRVDFNVPIDENKKILDDSRIKSSKDTVELLLKQSLKVVLVSHLGDPKDGFNESFSFKGIKDQIQDILGVNVQLSTSQNLQKIAAELEEFQNDSRSLFMIDNIRFFPGEKSNNFDFANDFVNQLKIDFYVNDAFSVSHRNHASVSAIPSLIKKKYAGLSLLHELYMLENILCDAFDSKKIITAILGGKKVETKMLLVKSLAAKVQNLVIVGGMANTFLKACGVEIGNSFYEPNMLDLANQIKNAVLPIDFINENYEVSTDLQRKKICDIGPKSLELIDSIIAKSDVVVWNGPAGIYEDEKFAKGTNEIARSISKHNVKSVVGGGDTAAVVSKLNLKIDHISNGGGAFIAWLEDKNLVGIKAIKYVA